MSDPSIDTVAHLHCPHCGEPVSIALDPGGGAFQEYFEDCEVCCRPWQVTVRYGAAGDAEVRLQPSS